MANTKSAKKQVRAQAKKAVYNQTRRDAFRDARKVVKKALAKGDSESAQAALSGFYKAVDKAAKSKTIHKNAAARYKSRLTKMVSSK